MISDSALGFLQRLLETASPSGFEEANAQHFRDYVASFADSVETDRHGNVIAAVNPEAEVRVMLSGHIDEIGFLVHHISDEGYLYFRPIGGHDTVVIVGQRVTVHTSNGPVPGVIGKKPIHLLSSDERDKGKVELHDLWIDLGVTGGKEEVTAAGVQLVPRPDRHGQQQEAVAVGVRGRGVRPDPDPAGERQRVAHPVRRPQGVGRRHVRGRADPRPVAGHARRRAAGRPPRCPRPCRPGVLPGRRIPPRLRGHLADPPPEPVLEALPRPPPAGRGVGSKAEHVERQRQ